MDFAATVRDVREEGRHGGRARWQLLLDCTSFSEGDTGALQAVARSGVRLDVAVLEVITDGQEIWHVVEKPLGVGTMVRGIVAVRGSVEF